MVLEGYGIKLIVLEKDRLPNLQYWLNDPRCSTLRKNFTQLTIGELEKIFAKRGNEDWWLIESERGSFVGFAMNYPKRDYQVIEYFLAPDEVEEVYGIKAVKLLVEHLYLNSSIARIQGEVLYEDSSGINVFESNGFISEGVKRSSVFHAGEWKDTVIYGLLREEWSTS
jgi:RimJ/RimL family protein N-acetyltransferase